MAQQHMDVAPANNTEALADFLAGHALLGEFGHLVTALPAELVLTSAIPPDHHRKRHLRTAQAIGDDRPSQAQRFQRNGPLENGARERWPSLAHSRSVAAFGGSRVARRGSRAVAAGP